MGLFMLLYNKELLRSVIVMAYSNNFLDLKNQFIKGKIKTKYDKISCKDIEKKECFNQIVNLCFNGPMTPRLIAGLQVFRKKETNENAISNILKDISNRLFNYMHEKKMYSKEEFDEYHNSISLEFMRKFNDLIKGKQSQVSRKDKWTKKSVPCPVIMKGINYGQAQKLINLSFKWLYCMNGVEKYLQKFEFCHVALDRVTYSEGWYHKDVNKAAECSSWSKLELCQYKTVQLDFSHYITTSKYHTASNEVLSPFQAEFYAWDEYYSVIK